MDHHATSTTVGRCGSLHRVRFRPSLALLLCLGAAAPWPCAAQQAFTDVTVEMGIDGLTGFGHAVAWCDTDDDGDPDLAFSNQDGSGFWLFRNDGHSFTDITAAAGLGGSAASQILCAELTGDSRVDLVLSRSNAAVYRGLGDGSFMRVDSGGDLSGRARCIADFDNDGAADLLTWYEGKLRVHAGISGGVFAAPVEVGVVPDCWTTVCADLDRNGLVDIYVGTYGPGANQLFSNLGGLVFEEIAAEAGVAWSGRTHGLDVGDVDNDGWPDLYLGAYSEPGCVLYRNLGNGSFVDQTEAAGVRGHTDTRTVSIADYDNDGFLDLFASHHDFFYYSNSLWHNNGDGTFTEVGEDLGLSGPWIGDSFGVGWADFNGDLDLDLFTAGHVDLYRLLRNDNGRGSSVIVDLRGRRSNHSAVGARVEVRACGRTMTRWVVAGSGQQDFHSLALHFGLGACTEAERLVVFWPSGVAQGMVAVAADQRLLVIEPNGPLAAPLIDR